MRMKPEKRILLLGDDARTFGREVAEPVGPRKKIAPRFLRRAKRRAELLGLAPKDDYEAVDLLLQEGIDILATDPPRPSAIAL